MSEQRIHTTAGEGLEGVEGLEGGEGAEARGRAHGGRIGEGAAAGGSLRSLIALAMGGFALGFAEFAMMGILPDVAAGMSVSVPWAGNFISAYAMGVCFGTLFLVFGSRIPPQRLLVLFAVLMVAGNAMAAVSPDPAVMLAARFVSGLPHGAYFGTATLVAKTLAEQGKEAQAVSIMVLGQTAANMVGVPFGTMLSGTVGWRAAFVFAAVWAAVSCWCILKWVPQVPRIQQKGLLGQFAFLGKPGPWLVLGAVFFGNLALFCWLSYITPWFTSIGGFDAGVVPWLLMLAGFGMVVGSLLGGHGADASTPAHMAAAAQGAQALCLLVIFFVSGQPACLVMTFVAGIAIFAMSSPQQLLMVKVGAGGGEMIGSACVQVAYNFANAVGAWVGQAVLNAGFGYEFPALAGVPFGVLSCLLLVVFLLRFEKAYQG